MHMKLDDSADGYVIVSLAVVHAAPIAELAAYETFDERVTDGSHWYQLGTLPFTEKDAARRAEELDRTILSLIDRLDGVPAELLRSEEVFVRLFITFPHGAETISSSTLRRLADVGVTIWLDFLE
ncbi:hypothetical protein L2X99_07030 [Microbacterium sp. KUDC0406]|uniref:hypothetical protein n=1 Tax=Microbacterium sp. KUDC0406 TaxID=2909588 RepID=UPI001F3153C9|nr:hypothetical protein [Microbacterium sp. KUDC0406]UJP11276.1 hypothetical protein L2X99_07030 [Microbacterium sp. KUDC0406]